MAFKVNKNALKNINMNEVDIVGEGLKTFLKTLHCIPISTNIFFFFFFFFLHI